MNLLIRQLSKDIVVKLDTQAKQLNLSREQLIRQILEVASLNPAESQLIYFRNEVGTKLNKQIQKNITLLEEVRTALKGEQDG